MYPRKEMELPNHLSNIKLNNFVVKTRGKVKQVLVRTCHKMTREIQRYRNSKADSEDIKKKKTKKANRFAREIKMMKKLSKDDITKFALQFDKKPDSILNDEKAHIKLKVLVKLAQNNILKKSVQDFRQKYPNWIIEVPNIIRNVEMKKKGLELSETIEKGENARMAALAKYPTDDDVNTMFKSVENGGGDGVKGKNKKNGIKRNEKNVKIDSSIDAESEEEEDEDESDEKEDEEDEDERDEKEEEETDSDNDKKLKKNIKRVVKGNKKNLVILRHNDESEEEEEDEDEDEEEEEEEEEEEKEEEEEDEEEAYIRNKKLDKKEGKPIREIEEETVVDDFFFTKDNKEYQSRVKPNPIAEQGGGMDEVNSGNRSERRQNNNPQPKDIYRKGKKIVINNRNNNKPSFSNFVDRGKNESNFNRRGFNNRETNFNGGGFKQNFAGGFNKNETSGTKFKSSDRSLNGGGGKFSERKSEGKFERKNFGGSSSGGVGAAGGTGEKLHPSWEAKKRHQPAITSFQGKKIKFD